MKTKKQRVSIPKPPTSFAELVAAEDDDLEFIVLVREILKGTVALYHPQEVFVIAIDNWFGEKWLSFAGKTVMGWAPNWQLGAKTRIPPFHPHRVRSQLSYRYQRSRYVRVATKPLHIFQWSQHNVLWEERSIRSVSDSAIFAWYGGRTRTQTHGSLMVYATTPETTDWWYVGFENQQQWKAQRFKGITKDQFEYIHALGTTNLKDQP